MTRFLLISLCTLSLAACVPPDGDDDDGLDDDDAASLPPGEPAEATLGAEVVCASPGAPGADLPFTDVTSAAGVAYASATPPWTTDPVLHPSAEIESHGGFSVSDLDGDGHLDLLFSDAVEGPKLFFGDGDFGFSEVDATTRGLPGASAFAHGVSTIDLEGDGDLDVFLLYMGFNRFFENDGTGHFTDITADLGLGGREDDRTITASWADFDRDGDLDVYVANHGEGSYGPGDSYTPDPDHFYVREPSGRFRDRIDWVLDEDQHGYAFLAGWLDADDDGWLDLYVVNDLAAEDPSITPNLFFRNGGETTSEGAWRFSHTPEAALDYSMLGMGLAVGDMDDDGDYDLHITNAGPTTLSRNDGGVFTDVSLSVAGFSDGSGGDISWATAWTDHDNDGDLELFTGYGHMPTKVDGRAPNDTRNRLEQPDALWSTPDGGGTFEDIAPALGLDNPERTRAAVVADIDRNGFPDLVTWALFDGPRLHRGGCNANAWTRISLEHAGSQNVSAVGSRVEAWSSGVLVAMGDIAIGSDEVMSAGPAEVLLGLGDAEEVDVVVRWPDGTTTVNEGVPTRRSVRLGR